MPRSYTHDERERWQGIVCEYPADAGQEMMRAEWWSMQRQACELVFNGDKDRIAIAAAVGVGKSYIAAAIAVLWLAAFPNGKVTFIGPRSDTLKKITWMEFAAALKAEAAGSGFLTGSMARSAMEYNITPDGKWQAVGVVVPSNAQEGIQGSHRVNQLVIVDEASGVPSWVFDKIDGWLTSDNNRLLMISNATRNTGTFYDAFTPGAAHRYNTMAISVYDTPNFTEEHKELGEHTLAHLPRPERVAAQRAEFERKGRTSEIQWQLMAEFPDQSDKAVINAKLLSAARQRCLTDDSRDVLWADPVFGFDAAREGDDTCVLALAQGPRCRLIDSWGQATNPESARRIAVEVRKHFALMREQKALHGRTLHESDVWINMDEVGNGGGIIDTLREIFAETGESFNVVGFKGGMSPTLDSNVGRFKNKRSEAWWTLRELLHEQEALLAEGQGEGMDLPGFMADWEIERDHRAGLRSQNELGADTLAEELLAPDFKHVGVGLIQVEAKEVTKKRLNGHSPDYADAVLHCYAPIDKIRGVVIHND